MKTLSIDIETYSDAPLSKCGVYRYAESDVFEVLLFAYSADGAPVEVVDLASGEKLPEEVEQALQDSSVTKWAHNAAFERVCLSRMLWLPRGTYLDPASWRCTMVWAATLGLPLSLMGAGTVLGLDKRKMAEGSDLVRYFCQPCAPTKANGGRTRNLPSDAPEKWEAFRAYNVRDVEVEDAIRSRLVKFAPDDAIWEQYALDQRINDRGVAVDTAFAERAIEMDEQVRARLLDEMRRITQLDNPNSVSQLKAWLGQAGVDAESLDKAVVARLAAEATGDVEAVLRLRQQLARFSLRKYQAMLSAVCADGRVRGMFQFMGAARTGRWAGRLVQMQNLPQNHLPDLASARSLVEVGDAEAVEMLYGDVPDTLSQLVRTAFMPKEGSRFLVADFSAIEARVIAWLAREQWRLDVFEEGGDIYCASASQMFGVPVEKHGANAHLRQKGKIAELALGYGGSVGALKAMGAFEMGLSEDELPSLVSAWRDSNPNITELWWAIDAAAMRAVRGKCRAEAYGIAFERRSGMLFATLPSGRRLAYAKPAIGVNRFGGECVTYEGSSAGAKWGRLDTYGPKLVENIVQATARDLLAHAMGNLAGARIVMHVHDEVVIEADGDLSVEEVCSAMAAAPAWAEGLALRADGYECPFYMKD